MSTAQIRTKVSFRKTVGLYPESATATVLSGEHKGKRLRFAPNDAMTCEDCTWLSWRAALALAKEIGQGDVQVAGIDNEGRTYYDAIPSDLDEADGYPRMVDGRTIWACCESQIGPKCQHLA